MTKVRRPHGLGEQAINECYPAHGVLFIKYCSILLQALTIETDEDFLLSLYDLTKIQGASWDADAVEFVVPMIGYWNDFNAVLVS